MKKSERDELTGLLANVLDVRFHPIEREVAGLLSEMRTKAIGTDNFGQAVARIESDLRALIMLLMGTPTKEQTARIVSLIKAHHEKAKPRTTAKVVPFPKKRKKP